MGTSNKKKVRRYTVDIKYYTLGHGLMPAVMNISRF